MISHENIAVVYKVIIAWWCFLIMLYLSSLHLRSQQIIAVATNVITYERLNLQKIYGYSLDLNFRHNTAVVHSHFSHQTISWETKMIFVVVV